MDKLIDAVKKYTLGIIQNEPPSEITGEFSFDRNFLGFSGHFPGYPIMPAVLQLLMAQILIEKQKGLKVRVTGILKAKFLSEIRPDDKITVKCADAAADNTQGSKIKISCGDRQVSSFNLYYEMKENSGC